jgi:hypothetical protein
MPQKFKITVTKQKRKIYSRLVTTDHGGQKNRNGKTNTVLFSMFSTSVWYDLFCKLTSTHGLNVDSFLSKLEVAVQCGD